MRKSTYSLLILIALFLFQCGASLQMFEEPVADKNLIIGSLIFNVDGYQDNFVTIKENIEVAIIGRVIQEGEIKTLGFWATTDEDGYFNLSNVPNGEYSIKGFTTRLIGIGDINIENELLDSQRNYFELKRHGVISFSGRLFDTRPNQRIINFKHNLITLNPNDFIQFERLNRLNDVKLTTGEIINQLPVPVHFYEKYEQSGWAKYLEMQIK
ncbi:hypothetical protein H8E88_34535 [candidate division KSB1 bacterium]|nr:hypothetical protein [candidate division KSB1 bacterium]